MAEEGQAFKEIFIQQDRVKNHISEDDKAFNDTLMEKGINTKIYMQAANSPDINLLDLGFSDPSRVSITLCQESKRS